ncbi:MAG TPA: DUF3017 domain-containing protein [Aeromicrobium sp.]|nr:DUF3017 domain-containing protein [Aeromicrobium sp.]
MLTFPFSRGSRLYLLVLAGVVVGLLLVLIGPWRIGLGTMGGSFIAGAGLRLVVPHDQSGLLRVRGRVFDAVWMTFLGVSLIVLAVIVPPPPS